MGLNMKFGINTRLYADAFTDAHVKDLFSKFKDMDFDGVEIALKNKDNLNYKKTLKAFKNYGLVCSSINGVFGKDRDIR